MSEFNEQDHPRDSDGKFANRYDRSNVLDNMSAAELSKALRREVSDDENIVKVNLDAEIQKQFDNATPKERQEIAFRYIMNNLRGKYPMSDGRIIAIERVGADKMTHSFDERKIRVLPELKTLLEVGRLRGVIDVEHKMFTQMAYYDVSFQIKSERYNAKLNIGIRNNGDSTLYDIKPIEETKK